MLAPLPASRLNEIKTRYAARVHVFQASVTWAIFLNTRRPPFDNLKARKALNYAIDRSKAIAGFGGVDAAALTCQILPPGMTGYRRYCPYTRHSNSQGIWTAPDLAKARKLVIASGTARQKVTVWTPSKHVPFLRFAAKLFVATLTRLGYSAKLKTVPGTPDIYFTKVQDPRTQAQAGADAWGPDFPAPSNTIGLFTCGRGNENNADPSHLCDPLLDKIVDRTLRRQTAGASAASNASWSKADRIVTDAAPWVPLVNSQTVVVVSQRVHNVQATTNSRVLIDQLWLR
jgi:peptide/nickel transport system substrate-binding protein